MVPLDVLDPVQRIGFQNAVAIGVRPDSAHHGEDIVDRLGRQARLEQLRLKQFQVALADVQDAAGACPAQDVIGLVPVVAAGAAGLLGGLHLHPAFDAFGDRAVNARLVDPSKCRRPRRIGEMEGVVEAALLDLGQDGPSLVVGIGDRGLVDADHARDRLFAALPLEVEGDAQLVAVDLDALGEPIDSLWQLLLSQGLPPIQLVMAGRL
ncbi:hypothetical protein D9M71_556260 [compost metagenome]